MASLAIRKGKWNQVMLGTVGLALLAALAYLLIAWNVLSVGDLQPEEEPAGIVYAAAACYLLGGLLILLRRRWLWIVGAVINAMVLFVFFQFYKERPAVMFSPAGIVSKVPQLLLEVGLIYLIVRYGRGNGSK